MRFFKIVLLILVITLLSNCGITKKSSDDSNRASSRNYLMGFTTWAYDLTSEAVNDTYQFLNNNGDIYCEHIDSRIPWNAWINSTALPAEFTNDIASRVAHRIPGKKLAVSVSLLNSPRNDLAYDFDNTTPSYTSFDDTTIENAYFEHLKYITNQLNPDYLVISIEANELLHNAPEKWTGYKQLMANIRPRIKAQYPSLKISESITLHNFYQPAVPNPNDYIAELTSYINDNLDYAAISFYPYFKALASAEEFQAAFDFLHSKVTIPIAFAETAHISEALTLTTPNFTIPGNEPEQKVYLETLCTNAQKHNYLYITWWCHRDYDNLWATFPPEVQYTGSLWLSTGIINENGAEKQAYASWVSKLKH